MASDEKPPSNAKPPLFKSVTLSAPMVPVEIISDIIIPDIIPNIICVEYSIESSGINVPFFTEILIFFRIFNINST